MTKVIPLNLCGRGLAGLFLLLAMAGTWCQGQQIPEVPPSISKPGEALYLQLRSTGLDRSRVFRIREATVDRPSLHITFDDGTIAFTEDVSGHVTGAFFEGDGEVLLSPPTQVERASMALFTGAAILEEHFLTGYFRFNDNLYDDLQPFLRPAENPGAFYSQWEETARNLAATDALRLFMTFSRGLPAPVQLSEVRTTAGNDDHMLHARLQGRKYGAFDVNYDSNATEQIWAGQNRIAEGQVFYDLWTAFSVAPPGGGSQSVDEMSPESARGDSIHVSQYKIQAEIKLPTELKADARLQMEVVRGGQRAILFELSRYLRLDLVEADRHPVEFIHNPSVEGTQLARRGNDWVAIIFPEPLRAGQQIELHFSYSGDVLSDAGGGLLYVGARGNWFPTHRLAMANFDLSFRYPGGWTLVATGKRTDEAQPQTKAAPGEQVSRWVSERPIPLAGFNLGKYTRASALAGSVLVETYAAAAMEHAFPRAQAEMDVDQSVVPGLMPRRPPLMIVPPPPSPAHNAQSVADISAKAIEFYSRRFGPSPYSTLAITQKPGLLSQGWPGLIFLSSFSFLSNQEKTQLHMDPVTRIESQNVIAHETAHQWWGDMLIWSGYRDQWIVEALANYSALMMLESEDASEFRVVLNRYREELLQKDKEGSRPMDEGPVSLGLRLSNSHFPNGYETISYGRGTWLLHMLRNMMRDAQAEGRSSSGETSPEPFVRALRRFREQYEGKSFSTRDFLRCFEEELPRPLWHEGKRSLGWFLESWIDGTAIPEFDLQGVKFIEKSGRTMVTGVIAEKDAPRDLVTAVPVYALQSGGKTTLIGQVFVDEAQTAFRLNVPAGTRKVILDPSHTLLSRNK